MFFSLDRIVVVSFICNICSPWMGMYFCLLFAIFVTLGWECNRLFIFCSFQNKMSSHCNCGSNNQLSLYWPFLESISLIFFVLRSTCNFSVAYNYKKDIYMQESQNVALFVPFSLSLKSSTPCGWPIFSTIELSRCICAFYLQYSFSLDGNVFVSFICNICPPSTHQILPQHVVDPFSPLLSFIAAFWMICLMFTSIAMQCIGAGALEDKRCGGWFRSLRSSSEHLGPWVDWVCPVDAPEYFSTNTITNT